MKVVILAAGKGSRLGDQKLPKPLTLLKNGNSILELQLKHISLFLPLDQVIVVVGYRKELIMENFPNLLFVYNPDYASENTAKSLLRAINKIDEDLIWINGDVVFHPSILKKILNFSDSAMVVNQTTVGEEEVKYQTDLEGRIIEVSKDVKNPAGEALGLNFFKASDIPILRKNLIRCENRDYFEKAIELSIREGLNVYPVIIDSNQCAEIDFPEDLERANQLLQNWNLTKAY